VYLRVLCGCSTTQRKTPANAGADHVIMSRCPPAEIPFCSAGKIDSVRNLLKAKGQKLASPWTSN
jgi:hypothetical protein